MMLSHRVTVFPDKIRRVLKRSQIFAARGPAYVATYGRWRAVRLGARLHQALFPPAWSPIPALPAADIPVGMSPSQVGPILTRYLTTREQPCFHFDAIEASTIAQTIRPEQQNHTLGIADALARGQHTYRGIAAVFDVATDWGYIPDGSQDWRWDLNRHYWLSVLARAWCYSGDPDYGRRAARLLRHWMDQNPPDVQNPVWRPFEVATRLNNWVWGLLLLIDCPVFAQEGAGHLWQGLVDQAQFLHRHLERHIVNNHLLIEAKTLGMLGLLFPELPEASKWLKIGLEILWTQVRRQFHPDGVHSEQATQYHLLCTGELWEMLSLLRRNGQTIPSDVLALFEAAVAFQHAIVKPDGHIPLFGDSSRHDLHRRFDARWALSWLGKKALPAGAPDEETGWLTGGMAPTNTTGSMPGSHAFPEGGYVVMRDATSYLVLDCGPFGDETVPSHAHADALSLELCAAGQTFLTDSGGYSYHAAPVWRNYFRGTRAHNTVVVDGRDQSELIGTRSVRRPARADLLDWCSTSSFDWAVAQHDGYTRFPTPVIHQRRVLFLKPHYWLLLDSLLGDGEHRLDWHFQLHPGITLTTDPRNGAARAVADGAGLAIVAQPMDGLHLQTGEGQTSPPLGWVSLESGVKTPAPHLILSKAGPLPVHLPMALVPYRSDQPVPVDLQVLEADAHHMVLALSTPSGQDYVGIALQDRAAKLQIEPFEARARLLVLRRFKEQPPVALVSGVQEIVVSGRQVSTGQPAGWVSLTEKGGQWRLTGNG